MIDYKENLDLACEKFRKILEGQLKRIEDMKSQGDFTDYAAIDTIKISGKNKFVDHTEERKFVWMAQTPQVFDTDLYRAASYYAESSQLQPTDDNSLIENIKHKIRLVECGRLNIKITTPEDLTVATAVIRERAKNGNEPLPEDTEE